MDADAMTVRLPTVEEVLSGETQGGVAPPPSFAPHEDDGSVERVSPTVPTFNDIRAGVGLPSVSGGDHPMTVATAIEHVLAARERFDAAYAALATAMDELLLVTEHGDGR